MGLEEEMSEGCNGEHVLAIDEGNTLLCKVNKHDCPRAIKKAQPVHYEGRVYLICAPDKTRQTYGNNRKQ